MVHICFFRESTVLRIQISHDWIANEEMISEAYPIDRVADRAGEGLR